jgi:hypothetical protein
MPKESPQEKMKPFCFSQNSYDRWCIILCSVALMLGGIIYVLFRITEPVFFHWTLAAGPDSWVNLARHKLVSTGQQLPEWIIFSLPNGLWAFAYAVLITRIWSGSKSWLRTCWMISIPVLVIGFEILQYFRIMPGTYCIQDVAMGIAGLTTGIIVGLKTIKPKNHEKAFD